MKLLTNKSITQKIIIALVFVILFNFISPQISFGEYGGQLFKPIKDLALVLADGAIWIIQKVIFGMDISLLKMEIGSADGWAIALGIFAGALVVAASAAAAIFSGGTSLAAQSVGSIVLKGIGGAVRRNR